MKKFLFLLLLPVFASADRLGSLKSNADVLLTTQTAAGVSVYPATATASFPFGLSAGTVTLTSASAGAAVCTDSNRSLTTSGCGGVGPVILLSSAIAFGASDNSIAGDTNTFTWDAANSQLHIAPGAGMSVIGSTRVANMQSSGFAAVDQHYVYVTANRGVSISVFDVSMATAPTLVSQKMGSLGGPLDGAEGIQIAGKYAFVVSMFSNCLTVYDISNPRNLVQVANVQDAAKLHGAEYLRIIGNFAYIVNFYAVAGSGEPALVVYDISNPKAPTYVSGIVNGNFYQTVYIVERYPYLFIDNEDTSCRIHTVDISDPKNPVYVGNVIPTGCSDQLAAMDLSGRYLYAASNGFIYTMDVSTPVAPSFVSSTTFSPTTIYRMLTPKVLGDQLFVTGSYGSSIYRFDLKDPGHPVFAYNLQDGANLIIPDDIQTYGNTLIITNHGVTDTTGGLSVVSVGGTIQPSAIVGHGTFDTLDVGKELRANSLTVNDGVYGSVGWIGNQLGVGNIVSVSSSAINSFAGQVQASSVTVTSATITSLTLAGGLGVSGALTVSGAITAASSMTVTGAVGFSSGVYLSTGSAAGNDAYVLPAYVDKSTVTWTNGNLQWSNLTANVTYVFNDPPHSETVTLAIATGAGSYAATWPVSVLWSGGTAPTITTAASKTDVVSCKYLAQKGKYFCSWIGNF